MSEAWAFGTLVVFALGLGAFALRVLGVPRESPLEFLPLAGAAGLGLAAVLVGVLALTGHLHWGRWLIPTGAVVTLARSATRTNRWPRMVLRRPSYPAILLFVMLGAACLGALAPTTDDDSLAYPIPIAQHVAHEGRWRFWPDQARSTFPLSQQMLVAAAIDAGGKSLGLLSAVELVLSALLIVGLGRRIGHYPTTGWLAAIIALGCPAVAFLASSAKEDLLLITMTMAGALSLSLPPGLGAAAGCGLFAGLVAGAKYSGAPLAIAVLFCVPFCCGRHRRWASVFIAATIAVAAGGLWYGVNLARFGNPVAPFLPWLGRPPMAAGAVAGWINGFGAGRGMRDALLAPLRLLYDPAFGGRGNWINPLSYLGVIGVAVNFRRRTWLPLLLMAVALYATWFGSIQVSRLLLPALALLSVPAADVLIGVWKRVPIARYPIAMAVALSAAIVIAVGLVRIERYLSDPATFLARETQYYDSVEWMNSHLDPARDRVATVFKSCGYLDIPWVNLDPTYQVEITLQELGDSRLLLAALKRQKITHVFGPPDGFAGLGNALVLLRINTASRIGGTRFFRPPLGGAAAIYAVSYPD